VVQAVDQARASLQEAKAADYKLSVCGSLRSAVCQVALMTGDLVAAERMVAMLIDLATRLGATLWKLWGSCLEGKLLIVRGELRAGSDLLRTTLDTYERIGWAVWYPEFLGVLAEGLAGLERVTEALATVDQALERADRGGERYYVAELLRIKGEVLLQLAGDQSIPPAEGCFREALEIAREQGALFWELRAALSLARLRKRQDRRTDGRQILAPVYDRFTGGFETTDLKQAKTLLEQLA
jgi:predicted ATPase